MADELLSKTSRINKIAEPCRVVETDNENIMLPAVRRVADRNTEDLHVTYYLQLGSIIWTGLGSSPNFTRNDTQRNGTC